jgi:hypothetical protein
MPQRGAASSKSKKQTSAKKVRSHTHPAVAAGTHGEPNAMWRRTVLTLG